MVDGKSATKRFVEILDECGFMDRIIESSRVNLEIRELENEARANRPPIAYPSYNTPLWEYLPADKAQRLRDLRDKKKMIREQENVMTPCIVDRLKQQGLVAINTASGVVIGQLAKVVSIEKVREATIEEPPHEKTAKEFDDEAVTGLSALFGHPIPPEGYPYSDKLPENADMTNARERWSSTHEPGKKAVLRDMFYPFTLIQEYSTTSWEYLPDNVKNSLVEYYKHKRGW